MDFFFKVLFWGVLICLAIIPMKDEVEELRREWRRRRILLLGAWCFSGMFLSAIIEKNRK